MSKPTRPAYKTRNWPAYNEALKRRGSLTIWFDPDMIWEADADRQTRPTARLQRCRDPDLPDDEGAVRHGASPDDRVRRKPAAPDRSGLGGSELQHPQPPSEDA